MEKTTLKNISVKKHTFKRKLKAWQTRFHNRQQHLGGIPKPDESEHTCIHCGYNYKGRLCPQCGMPASWKRFSAKQLLNSFLDIWGLGNRPMFRSMGHLLWRPGYMIRDYLSGHYLSYFPPFKMLAVLIVLTTFIVWILGIENINFTKSGSFLEKLEENMSGKSLTIMKGVKTVYLTIVNNHLYRVLTQNLIIVLAAWLVFRKREIQLDCKTRRRLNLVETFYSQIYINCQFQLVTLLYIILRLRIPTIDFYPYAVPDLLVTIILGYDFHQLYQLSFGGTVWRVFLFILLTALIYVVLLCLLLLFAMVLYIATNV